MAYRRSELLSTDNFVRCYTNIDFVRGAPITETVCYYNGKKYKRNLNRKGAYPLTEKAAMQMIVRDLQSKGKHIENIDYPDIGMG